ncbi:MAG: RNA polymerase sigma-54 factor [Phycisphaerales bacterium]|nr:MAG: RNA polymerase sigma-54 factor [Phycisphaerales bacterium]
MRFETSQSMKLGQQMKLAPRMIQSMEILQMPLAQLEERIEQELESNITLELVSPEEAERRESDGHDAPDRDAREEGDQDAELDFGDNGNGAADDFARLDDFAETHPDAVDNAFDTDADAAGPDADRDGRFREAFDDFAAPGPSRRLAGEPDAKFEAMANAPARSAGLADQLLGQWALTVVEERLRPLGEVIIQSLEDDGSLKTPLEELVERAPRQIKGWPEGERPTLADFARALQAVQLFLEPAGVAARDARECLLLQLDALEDEGAMEEDDRGLIGVARTLVEDHLEDLMQNRLPRVAEKAGLTLAEIKGGLQVLRRLSLSPARRLVNDTEPGITPDVIVEYDEDNDRYIAFLNDSRAANLAINREYAEMVRDRSVAKKDRDFVRTNLSNAQWLIDAVQQRRHTLLRVVNAVVDAQRDFFDYGPESLRPLPMTQVGEQLGIHVATVSRAVSDKHLMTPRGVVPLRRFFTGGTQTDSGEEVSWDAIKAALKDVVAEEDKANPLSDDKLVDALKAKGIEIARRTVAKYRSQLGIPSARLRRAF